MEREERGAGGGVVEKWEVRRVWMEVGVVGKVGNLESEGEILGF